MFEMSVMNFQTSATGRSITTPLPSTLVISGTLQLLNSGSDGVRSRTRELRHSIRDAHRSLLAALIVVGSPPLGRLSVAHSLEGSLGRDVSAIEAAIAGDRFDTMTASCGGRLRRSEVQECAHSRRF